MNRIAVAVIVLSLWCQWLFASSLQSLDVQEKSGVVSIHFSISGPFSYKAFTLKNPERLVVDLIQAKQGSKPFRLDQNALIRGIRVGQPDQHTLRVVFDLKQSITIESEKFIRALTITCIPTNSKLSKAHLSTSHKINALNPPLAHVHKPPQSLREVVVVLDPGHGGKDPGAIGSARHLEKNIVLAIALKLKKIIDKEPGMRAVLTRKGDYYVGLRQRLNIARKNDADIFISIHADAFKNRKSKGASVFALSPTGATSEAARWLAEKENYSELGGVNLDELDDKNGLIRSVLIDLSQTATIGASLQMGEQVLHSMDDITRLHHEDVEQARFVVLKSPDIPSILIETGFISNPKEEKNLSSAWYQTKLSKAIFNGVKQYFYEYPPHDTQIEAFAMEQRKHLVKKGDTLGHLARRYHTTVANIKKINHLKSDILRTGQSLEIPKSWT